MNRLTSFGNNVSSLRLRARVWISIIVLMAGILPVFSAPLEFSQAASDLKATDPARKYAAVQALKNYGSQGAVAELAKALPLEKNTQIQAAMLNSLSSMHDESAIPAIAPLLSAPSAFLRQRAAHAIGLLGGPTAEKVLDRALPAERDTYVRSTEVMGLSLCGSNQSIAILTSALEDPKSAVRAQAIQALRRIPGNAAVKALRGHAESDPQLRKRIQEAIEEKANRTQ